MEQVDVIVTERCGVAASKESTTAMTDVEQQQPLADGDAMLKCFSPLLSSMNMFGLYFTQASRHIQDASAPTSEAKDSQVPRKWTAGRIYALVIVVVAWLNTVRTLSAFEKRDKFGLVLFVKLASVAGGLFSALQHTACFVACQTGNLDRVFLDARLPKSDVARYRRLAVIHTIVCWVFLLAGSSTFVFSMFVGDSVSDLSMKIFDVNFLVSHQLFIVVEVINGLTFILTEYTWFFSHSVNYMITSVLCDQFRALNEDFNRAVGYGGEFRGSIRESRRRHQELSQSVQNTDRFMMISNTAGICCPIMNVILILYCALFFRDETIGQGEFSAITYVYWLASTLVGLTLTACQGVAVNHAVRIAGNLLIRRTSYFVH